VFTSVVRSCDLGYRTKQGPAGWEEAGPSIIPLAHVPDVGEWRIVQTARGNRKGLDLRALLNFYKAYP
jgi:hypothetical protein